MGPIVWAMNFHYAYCLAGTRFQARSIGAFTYLAPWAKRVYDDMELMLDFRSSDPKIHSSKYSDRHFWFKSDEDGNISLHYYVWTGHSFSVDQVMLDKLNCTHLLNMAGVMSGDIKTKCSQYPMYGIYIYHAFFHFKGLISFWRYVRYYLRYIKLRRSSNYRICEFWGSVTCEMGGYTKVSWKLKEYIFNL